MIASYPFESGCDRRVIIKVITRPPTKRAEVSTHKGSSFQITGYRMEDTINRTERAFAFGRITLWQSQSLKGGPKTR